MKTTDIDSRFRIVQVGRTGRYMVQKKGWFGWNCAIWWFGDAFQDDPATYKSVEEAEGAFRKVYCTPDRVVKAI